MKQHLNIENEPDFHKIIIASIVLHILFLSLAAVPTRTKERDEASYFVNLVSPGETVNAPAKNISKMPPGIAEEKVKAAPDIKIKKEKKLPLAEAVPEEKPQNTAAVSRTTPPPPLSRHTVKESLPSGTGHEIRREFQKQKGGNLRDKASLEGKYRSQAFAETKALREEQIMIPAKNKPVLTDRGPIERISRGPAFASQEITRHQEGMIAREKKPAEEEKAVMTGKSGFINASDRTIQRKETFASAAREESSAMITKPDISGETGKDTSDQGRQDEQGFSGRDVHESNVPSHNDQLSASAFSIQGVPLNDLRACSHALDERTLKNELLKILGSSRGCYSPATGTYVFLGAGRYTSFDMMISPAAGRELSNRCEELRNALKCLHSIKE